MRGALLVAMVLALAGCDRVFGLVTEADDVVSDAGGDAETDAPTDARIRPCASATHHDEDGDEIDDGCDLCPGDYNPDATAANDDDDLDGIGNECDPISANACTVRWKFISFAASDPTVQLPPMGTWQFANDDLNATSVPRAVATFAGGTFFSVALRASVDIAPMGGVDVGTNLALDNGAWKDTSTGLFCQYLTGGGTFGDTVFFDYFVGQAQAPGSGRETPTTRAPTRVVMDIRNDQLSTVKSCLVTPGLVQPVVYTGSINASTNPLPAGIAVESAAQAAFHWVDIVSLDACAN